MAQDKTGDGKFRVAVLVSGRGSNLSALIKMAAERDCPFQICVVLSDQRSAAALQLAQEAAIPSVVIERLPKERNVEQFNLALADALASHTPDLVVLAGFMRVLKREFISRFKNRIINIHPSLLPAFPGLHAQRQALEAGVDVAGCTVHIVTEEVDAGPILAQAEVPIVPGDTEETLAARILIEEHRILPAVVRKIALREIKL